MRRLLSTLFGSSSRNIRPETDDDAALDRALSAMERQLAEVDTSLLAVVEARRQLEHRKAALDATAGLRSRQAERAAALGRDDLARRALSLRNRAERDARQLESSVQEVSKHVESLASARDTLRQRLDQLRSRRVEMGARLTAAEAQLQIRDAAASAAIEAAEASRVGERLTVRTGRIQGQTKTDWSVSPGSDDQEEPLEQEIRELEREMRVDAELERLRREALAERSTPDAGDEGREP